MRRRLLGLVASAAASILIAFLPTGPGYSGGVTEAQMQTGCNCHGRELDAPEATIEIKGLPATAERDVVYPLELVLHGPDNVYEPDPVTSLRYPKPYPPQIGGFLLQASLGELAPHNDTAANPPDREGEPRKDLLSHTKAGTVYRSWSLQWVVPRNVSSSGEATFRILGAATNGDATTESAIWDVTSDVWTRGEASTAVAPRPSQPPSPTPTPAEKAPTLALPVLLLGLLGATGLARVVRRR